MIIVSAACAVYGCTENEEVIARRELERKFMLLETASVTDFALVERVKEYRSRDYSAREIFEKEQKGKKVQWDVIVRSIDKYTEGISGASKEYYLVSSKPVISMDNTFIDIIVPKNVAQTVQVNQQIRCTGFIKYVTLGGDGHVILFPAKIDPSRQ